MSEDKSDQQLTKWYKKIEMIGMDIKGLEKETETGRFKLKTNLMNAHFINELDKIGLQLINIRGTLIGRLVVLLEAKNVRPTSS
ncbi:MAG: hypothetical protein WA364_00425 [Candidatus Nitrosopolaris sp.]|jgi:hypothetical protein